jgi:hypothetical protein
MAAISNMTPEQVDLIRQSFDAIWQVRRMLAWGLERQFGAAFTPELKTAWITLYDAVQGEMMRTGCKIPEADDSPRQP